MVCPAPAPTALCSFVPCSNFTVQSVCSLAFRSRPQNLLLRLLPPWFTQPPSIYESIRVAAHPFWSPPRTPRAQWSACMYRQMPVMSFGWS